MMNLNYHLNYQKKDDAIVALVLIVGMVSGYLAVFNVVIPAWIAGVAMMLALADIIIGKGINIAFAAAFCAVGAALSTAMPITSLAIIGIVAHRFVAGSERGHDNLAHEIVINKWKVLAYYVDTSIAILVGVWLAALSITYVMLGEGKSIAPLLISFGGIIAIGWSAHLLERKEGALERAIAYAPMISGMLVIIFMT